MESLSTSKGESSSDGLEVDRTKMNVPKIPAPGYEQPPLSTTSQQFENATQPRPRRWLPSALVLFLAFLLMTAVAIALGGGLGAAYAHEKNKNKNSASPSSGATRTITVTGTPSASSSPQDSSGNLTDLLIPTSNCSSLPNPYTVIVNSQSWTFQPECGQDRNSNDVLGIRVYYFTDCIDACASFQFHSSDVGCSAVSYQPDQSPLQNGNCWLKTGSSGGGTASKVPGGMVDSALRINPGQKK